LTRQLSPSSLLPKLTSPHSQKKIETVEELKSISIPKVVFDYNNFAMYFSRSPIPFVRGARTSAERLQRCDIYKHIGLYVYSRESLLAYTQLCPYRSRAGRTLEQLRMLENGFKIKVVVTEYETSLSIPRTISKEPDSTIKRFAKTLTTNEK